MMPVRRVLFNIINGAASVRCVSGKCGLVDVAVDNEGIATVTMQRPPVNALNQDLFRAIYDTVDELDRNKCKGMVLTSDLPTVFSAGLDLKELYKPDLKRLEALKYSLFDTVEKLFTADVITTSAINGHTSAGSCVLAMLCEYRAMVCGGPTISFNDTAVGITPGKWIIDLITRNMGVRQAEYVISTSVKLPADAALKIGFIDDVAADKADAVAKCKKFIKMFDNVPRETRINTKRAMRGQYITELKKHRDQYVRDFLNAVTTAQTQDILEQYLQMLKQRNELNK